jgi:hypothetical protein
MSQKAWTAAARKFRKKWGFPLDWKRGNFYQDTMDAFYEGFLQGYNASNTVWQKKGKRK